MNERIALTVSEGGERLDVFLFQNAECSRSAAKLHILNGMVTVNGQRQKPNYVVRTGDKIEVTITPPKEIDLAPENIPLDIVYEDEALAVINKPKGLVVHPAAGNESGTLVNALLFHIKDLSGINGEIRPGIVHRLDKDTSGLLVIAKNDAAHIALSEQIKQKTAVREYLAIATGNIKEDTFTVNAPIGRDIRDRKKMCVTEKGRAAVTHFTVLERFGSYTLLNARLETGRTHQIRVHLKHVNHPVAGDPLYGPKTPALTDKGQLLCAYKMSFAHPKTGERLSFEIEPDAEFLNVLYKLRKINKI